MIAAIEITPELVPYIILAVAAIFAFGYFIGYKLGRIDGNTETAKWYDGRRERTKAPTCNGRYA